MHYVKSVQVVLQMYMKYVCADFVRNKFTIYHHSPITHLISKVLVDHSISNIKSCYKHS